MKEIAVVSGKGGTGKTTVVASFAALARRKVLADCDVDAADLQLVLGGEIRRREIFTAGKQAVIRRQDCIACGSCLDHCRYEAVRRDGGAAGAMFTIDRLSCEGCGVCAQVCPVGAIDLQECRTGEWFVSQTRQGPMVHARLGIAAENSGKLVTIVRKEAARIAAERALDMVIIDGPPGIGCPVIASIGGASLVLAVTEPTLTGLHDLRRVAELAAHFGVPVMVCINKFDINREMSAQIRSYCGTAGLQVAGELPYDTVATRAQLTAESVVEYSDSVLAAQIRDVWDSVAAALFEEQDD